MANKFRASFTTRAFNTIVTSLLRAGIKIGNMTLLTVRGRKTGQPRTTPVVIIEQDGQRWVSSPYGEVDWVRNLRTAREATLTRGRKIEQIVVHELSAKEAAVILKQILGGAPSFLLKYYDVTPTAPLEEFEREAVRHPTFSIQGAAH
jgi:deazaflavin-dependent oxidoreductase (nitroreductase family)